MSRTGTARGGQAQALWAGCNFFLIPSTACRPKKGRQFKTNFNLSSANSQNLPFKGTYFFIPSDRRGARVAILYEGIYPHPPTAHLWVNHSRKRLNLKNALTVNISVSPFTTFFRVINSYNDEQ
jgi:hypothetical protein